MSQTEIIKALEDYMSASLGVNGETTRRAKEAIKELKSSCSEKPNNSPTEMSGTFDKSREALKKIIACYDNPDCIGTSCNGCEYRTSLDEDHKAIEMALKAFDLVKILARALANSPGACDRLLAPYGWCEEHCKEGQDSPDAECWLRYAEVIASD